MVGLTEATAALNGLKAVYDMAKGVQALTSDAEVKLATIKLMEGILAAQQNALAAQEAQAALLKRVGELEAQLNKAEQWEREKERYELHRFPAGTFAYVLKADKTNGEEFHRICQKCFEDGHKSLLQTVARVRGGETVMCPRCDMKLIITESERPAVVRSAPKGWDRKF